MNLNQVINVCTVLLSGIGTLLEIFFITLVLALPLGLIVALARNSKCKILSWIMKNYILLIRGTPMILQIIIVYFCPYYLFNVTYDRFLAIIIAFTINYAAYFGEIFRSGIESIPKGQWEAAFTLGFNKTKTFFLIVLPQAIKRTLPAISNEVITLVRDTSLAQVIGITELFSIAQKQANFKFSIIPLIAAGVIYLIISFYYSSL